jgi:hypothetical protein
MDKHAKVAAHLKEITAPKAEAKPKAKKRSNRLSEEVLLAEYPHVVPGTLHFLPNENKQAVTIACVEEDCDKTREVRTSDLFQVKRCEICTIKDRRRRAKARRAAKKADDASSEDS